MAERMSDVEALMWNLEKDPHLASTFANVTILDRAPDVDRLRHRLGRAMQLIPRLRQRVVPALGRLAPPEWRDDPDADVAYHVRELGLPPPGRERQLWDLAATLAQMPLDRSRPLWEFTVVTGLEGGRAALLQKMHHALTDGEGGLRMSLEFLDAERDAPDPPPVETVESLGQATGSDRAGLLATAWHTVVHDMRRQRGIALRTVAGTVAIARHPERIPRLAVESAATAQSLARQGMITDPARSGLWTERSLRRYFDVLRVPLADAKRAAEMLGGTVNDFFVTGAAGGAAAYHRKCGVDVDELRVAMPISTRASGAPVGGNAFTPTRVLVPAGIVDPAERFRAVKERLGRLKGERAIGAVSALAGVLNLLPTSMLVRFGRQQVETVDFATSNLRGAPMPLYIGGALIEGNYPMGPLAGTAFNLTTLSYNGNLDMGLHVDGGAVEDPTLLRGCIEDAFAELLAVNAPGGAR